MKIYGDKYAGVWVDKLDGVDGVAHIFARLKNIKESPDGNPYRREVIDDKCVEGVCTIPEEINKRFWREIASHYLRELGHWDYIDKDIPLKKIQVSGLMKELKGV